MKINITRKVDPSEQHFSIVNPYAYIRNILDHLANEILIKDIRVTYDKSQNLEFITIKAHPVGTTLVNEELAKKVRDVISTRSDLTITRFAPRETMQIPAIKKENDSTYAINAFFAHYVAYHPVYCDSLRKNTIAEALVEYKKTSPTQIKTTGKVTTFAGKPNEPTPLGNIYRCFAQTVAGSTSLKYKFGDPNVSKVVLNIDKQHQTCSLSVMVSETFPIKTPLKP